jgi:hypothetical protein
MLRLAALLFLCIAMSSAAMAQDAQQSKQDTVEVHGEALQLSCAKWKRDPDGSWTSIGALLVGTETMNMTLRGKETKVLEAKCGDTQEPIVTSGKALNRRAMRGADITMRSLLTETWGPHNWRRRRSRGVNGQSAVAGGPFRNQRSAHWLTQRA